MEDPNNKSDQKDSLKYTRQDVINDVKNLTLLPQYVGKSDEMLRKDHNFQPSLLEIVFKIKNTSLSGNQWSSC